MYEMEGPRRSRDGWPSGAFRQVRPADAARPPPAPGPRRAGPGLPAHPPFRSCLRDGPASVVTAVLLPIGGPAQGLDRTIYGHFRCPHHYPQLPGSCPPRRRLVSRTVHSPGHRPGPDRVAAVRYRSPGLGQDGAAPAKPVRSRRCPATVMPPRQRRGGRARTPVQRRRPDLGGGAVRPVPARRGHAGPGSISSSTIRGG
jgi:hypothetical protein